MTDLELRKRRAAWRSSHRGTKELDILVGQYAAARLANMSASELDHFEAFIDVNETELQSWLLAPRLTQGARVIADDRFTDLVADVRGFHGLID